MPDEESAFKGGGGLTDGGLLSLRQSEKESSSLSRPGKMAATRFGLSDVFGHIVSETTPTVVLCPTWSLEFFWAFTCRASRVVGVVLSFGPT